jgi:hypothetical protein
MKGAGETEWWYLPLLNLHLGINQMMSSPNTSSIMAAWYRDEQIPAAGVEAPSGGRLVHESLFD